MQRQAENVSSSAPGARALAAVLTGFGAAWLLAGSTGLMAHSLRNVLGWLALGVAVVAGWPAERPACSGVVWGLAALVAAFLLGAPGRPALAVLAVPLVMAWLVSQHKGTEHAVLGAALAAVSVFALYRLLVTSVPFLWLTADRAGRLLGVTAAACTDRPLFVGATFAGLDFLVLMLVWYAAWLTRSPAPRARRACWGLAGIAAGHGVYLLVLAHAADLLALLPGTPGTESAPGGWPALLRHMIPWHLPLLALVAHGVVAAAMIRWPTWSRVTGRLAGGPAPGRLSGNTFTAVGLTGVAALLLAAVTTLCVNRPSLDGRRIVLYEQGFLNWLKPEHGDYGRLSIGMYGLLPRYIESLGATCIVSPDLRAEHMDNADVVVLIYPDKPWPAGGIDRLREYVRRGGTLLVLGEHTIREEDGGSRFNDVLCATSSMQVRFDSATYAVGGWLQSYEMLAHPTTLGMADDRNQLGIVIGASLDAHWPARPVVVGRWGWSDRGDPGKSAMMGDGRYNAGEKLGDLVLVAEQRLGKGRVVAFGDTSTFSNGINMGSHPFTSRLFGYLASGRGGPQSTWRGVLALLLALLLAGRIAPAASCVRHAAVACVVLAVCLPVCTGLSERASQLLPDCPAGAEYELAYLDASHLGAFSGESWRDDGLMGLALNLMRNRYLTLTMPEFSAERLNRAELFVSVAPARAYTRSERRAIRAFIEGGGLFVLTVGDEDRLPARSLMEELGFGLGPNGTGDPAFPLDRPLPMGHFKAPYWMADEAPLYVRFHAAWPVTCSEEGVQTIVNGKREFPVIVMRRLGKGKAVLIGDTGFAMNKNLEVESGAPFEGMRENPHFWRWFLSYLRGGPVWTPPLTEEDAP
ncbi:MAG: hypothetical protein JXR37_15735 [Kiritimatiellae bacterium]|nr:hypothetical protein [Kiritimatiellia bacterium]